MIAVVVVGIELAAPFRDGPGQTVIVGVSDGIIGRGNRNTAIDKRCLLIGQDIADIGTEVQVAAVDVVKAVVDVAVYAIGLDGRAIGGVRPDTGNVITDGYALGAGIIVIEGDQVA